MFIPFLCILDIKNLKKSLIQVQFLDSHQFFAYLCIENLNVKQETIYSQSTKPTIMQINKAKKYGEFVDITAPVERTTSEEYPNVLGGEIWYN